MPQDEVQAIELCYLEFLLDYALSSFRTTVPVLKWVKYNFDNHNSNILFGNCESNLDEAISGLA